MQKGENPKGWLQGVAAALGKKPSGLLMKWLRKTRVWAPWGAVPAGGQPRCSGQRSTAGVAPIHDLQGKNEARVRSWARGWLLACAPTQFDRRDRPIGAHVLLV
jgi:hypothetical protein